MINSPIRFALAGLDHHYWALSLGEAISKHRDARLVAIGAPTSRVLRKWLTTLASSR